MSTLDALLHAQPDLPHPVTYDAVEQLVERLRADLALAEAALVEMRSDEIAALEARLAALRGETKRKKKPALPPPHRGRSAAHRASAGRGDRGGANAGPVLRLSLLRLHSGQAARAQYSHWPAPQDGHR